VACLNIDGVRLEALRERLEEAEDDGAWLVLGGHEVGTADFETVGVETLEAVVQWCRNRAIWIDTVGAIGRHIASVALRDQSSNGL
jgi:hypothetical protein